MFRYILYLLIKVVAVAGLVKDIRTLRGARPSNFVIVEICVPRKALINQIVPQTYLIAKSFVNWFHANIPIFHYNIIFIYK